jgi:ABC-type antimicrobial peptide transport system permease subunit
VRARLVATATRFPTTQDSGDSFVIADEASLASALGADDLPTSIPDELWLSAPQGDTAQIAAALRKPPFSALDVTSRAAIHSDLQHDPIARGIVSSLVAAAIAALALALLGVALATLGFLRDEGDSLFDLESQGAGPRALRACVRWRALGLALLGVLAGVGLGVALAIATGRLLALDATLAVPDPPLLRITPWLTIATSAAVLALLAAVLVEASLHVAYRRGAAGRGVTGEQWAE